MPKQEGTLIHLNQTEDMKVFDDKSTPYLYLCCCKNCKGTASKGGTSSSFVCTISIQKISHFFQKCTSRQLVCHVISLLAMFDVCPIFASLVQTLFDSQLYILPICQINIYLKLSSNLQLCKFLQLVSLYLKYEFTVLLLLKSAAVILCWLWIKNI